MFLDSFVPCNAQEARKNPYVRKVLQGYLDGQDENLPLPRPVLVAGAPPSLPAVPALPGAGRAGPVGAGAVGRYGIRTVGTVGPLSTGSLVLVDLGGWQYVLARCVGCIQTGRSNQVLESR